MSFPIALDARHILLPVNLFQQDGSRLQGPLPAMGAVSVMVVGLTGDGAVFQEMHPLRVRDAVYDPFDGHSWELRSLPAGLGYYAYYIGIPDSLFALQAAVGCAMSPAKETHSRLTESPHNQAKVKALSLEVVGSSGLGRTVGFNGGADIHLEVETPIPITIALIQLLERFYPDLWQGLDAEHLQLITDPADHSWVLWMPSTSHSLGATAPAQAAHFHPRMHQDAVLEGLVSPSHPEAYWIIQAGCYREDSGRLGHWFGQRFGLMGAVPRSHAVSIAENKVSGKGWLFWLKPVGLSNLESDGSGWAPEWAGPPAVRHAALHQALSRGFPGQANQAISSPQSLTARGEGKPTEDVHVALRALEALAQIWLAHRSEILAWRSLPANSEWSQDEFSATSYEGKPQTLLAIAEDFIAAHRPGLRALERLQEEEWESTSLRHPVDRLLALHASQFRKPANLEI